jgi:single-strand DNA-binding protein
MLTITLAGNLGRDAEFKQTQGGADLCSFSVAAETGFGENKATTWVDVTKWGKGAEGLSRILRKGSKVAVTGEMTLREHNGKTYVQCRADHIAIMGTPGREPDGSQGAATDTRKPAFADDLDDDIPFVTSDGIW